MCAEEQCCAFVSLLSCVVSIWRSAIYLVFLIVILPVKQPWSSQALSASPTACTTMVVGDRSKVDHLVRGFLASLMRKKRHQSHHIPHWIPPYRTMTPKTASLPCYSPLAASALPFLELRYRFLDHLSDHCTSIMLTLPCAQTAGAIRP